MKALTTCLSVILASAVLLSSVHSLQLADDVGKKVMADDGLHKIGVELHHHSDKGSNLLKNTVDQTAYADGRSLRLRDHKKELSHPFKTNNWLKNWWQL